MGTGKPSMLTRARLSSIIDHVEMRLAHRLSVMHLARLAHLSSAHFSRRFKLVAGMPPAQYVSWRRLERAKLLMLKTAHSLAQISVDCGFADQSHFNRAFQRNMRISPAKWRRDNAARSNDSAALNL
jgi:AraC family transcriptional regulator